MKIKLQCKVPLIGELHRWQYTDLIHGSIRFHTRECTRCGRFQIRASPGRWQDIDTYSWKDRQEKTLFEYTLKYGERLYI